MASSADAAEPAPSPKKKKSTRPRPDHCLNCEEPTAGNFCANCGQENEDETVALKLLTADFLSDLASFDSRLFRTLVPLLIRPGFLTNEYNAGRRVRYLSPFKLYLTMSVLFFVILPLTHHASLVQVNSRTTSTSDAHESVKEANSDLKDSGVNIHLKAPTVKDDATLSLGNQTYDLTHLPKTVEAYNSQQRDPRHTRDPKIVQYVKRQIIKVKQSPQALSDAMLDYIPKMMFLLLPAFALSLKLVYFRSKRLYIEHLIFALHLHAFLFLLLTLLLVIQLPALITLLVIVALLYPYIAMRVVYKQGWLKTFVKYSLLAFNYLFLLLFTLLGAAAVALLLV